MNTNGVYTAWSSLCPPAQLYAIVLTASVLYQIYRKTYRHALRHAIMGVIGTFFLWILCAAHMEFAAYGLLVLPIVFLLFLLAIVVYDQTLFEIQHAYKPGNGTTYDGCGCCDTAKQTGEFCDCCA